LIADILPPPEYLVEAYLVVYQMVEEGDPGRLKNLVQQSKSLRDDYEKRHEYWIKNLPDGNLKEELVTMSYQPAMKFLDTVDEDIIPAIMRNDRESARESMNKSLKPFYDGHRKAIDKVVKMADQTLKEEEDTARAIISRRTIMLSVLGFTVMGALLICFVYVNHITSRVGKDVSQVRSGELEPDLSEEIGWDDFQKTGTD